VPEVSVALVEREHELDALQRLLMAAREGVGGTVVVEGPPGIGKSSLLAAAGRSADGFQVLRARGSELEREFPFGVVRQLLEPTLAQADAQGREALLSGAAALAGPNLFAVADASAARGSAVRCEGHRGLVGRRGCARARGASRRARVWRAEP
jgi:AAA ATPase domain